MWRVCARGVVVPLDCGCGCAGACLTLLQGSLGVLAVLGLLIDGMWVWRELVLHCQFGSELNWRGRLVLAHACSSKVGGPGRAGAF